VGIFPIAGRENWTHHFDVPYRQPDEEASPASFDKNLASYLYHAHTVAVANGTTNLHPATNYLKWIRRSL
jgi:hypothetical protein